MTYIAAMQPSNKRAVSRGRRRCCPTGKLQPGERRGMQTAGRAVVQTPERLLAWEREAPVTGVEARGRGHSRDGIKARASTAVSTPPVIP